MVVAFKVRIFQKSQISIQVKSFCQVIFFVIMSVTLVVHISDSQHLTVESDQCVFYVVVSCQLVVCARKKPSVDNVQESGVSPSLVNCRREPCVVLLGLHLYRSCNINPLFSALFKHPVVHSVSFQKSSMCGGWVGGGMCCGEIRRGKPILLEATRICCRVDAKKCPSL